VLHRRVRGIGPGREAAVLLLDAARIEKLYPLPLVLVLQVQTPQQLMTTQLPVLQLLPHLEPDLAS